MDKDYLSKLFINEAKPSLSRHSGSGGGGDSREALRNFLAVMNCTKLFANYAGESVDSLLAFNDTSGVTDMYYMFGNCTSLTSVPELNTQNVTNMDSMFCYCESLTSVPKFDTRNVTNMDSMFYYCISLTSVPEFDTHNVTSMRGMLNSCKALTSVPKFDTSSVTDMSTMLYVCDALTSVPKFDTSSVTNMKSMFGYCASLTSVPEFDTRSVTDMSYMFIHCEVLTTVPEFDTRSVTNMSNMFNACTNLTSCLLRNIKTNLTVGSGSTYGHLLTVDSLIHLVYELRKQSSSKTLTVGTANLEKLASVYVKLVDITDEMRAADDLIDEKYPFVVCESTDEGAMLITDYASDYKTWVIK